MRVRPRRGQKILPSGGHTFLIPNFSTLGEIPNEKARSEIFEALDHKWFLFPVQLFTFLIYLLTQFMF